MSEAYDRSAEPGGAVLPPSKSSWPTYEADEIAAVTEVLRTGRVNYWNGDEGRAFEEEFADYCGSAHGIAVANGTVGLELALYALDVGPGDEVIVAPRTFLASASCVVARGATPVFADIDPVSQNICAKTIAPVISEKTKAIIPVHLAGWPCDMDPIMELAVAHDLKVVEDCAQAHGADYKGRKVGSIGHAGVFSFCTDKIMSLGGEGGMMVTDDPVVWEKAWGYKDHGKSYDAVYNWEHGPGFRWLHQSFGTNWRLTEMQSAIGRVQLGKLPAWLEARRRNANILNSALRDCPGLRLTQPGNEIGHAYYKYYAFVRPEKLKPGWSRDRILSELEVRGLPGLSGSCSEIYLEKAFEGSGFGPDERLPTARELGETSLMLLVDHTLDEKDIFDAAKVLRHVMKLATR